MKKGEPVTAVLSLRSPNNITFEWYCPKNRNTTMLRLTNTVLPMHPDRLYASEGSTQALYPSAQQDISCSGQLI